MVHLVLPLDGELVEHELGAPGEFTRPTAPLDVRRSFAAAHVVADPLRESADGSPPVDWDATLSFRRHLWSWGLSVADAMDTAQRGMGMDWPTTRQLIRLSGEEARATGGDLACGAATDQLDPGPATLDAIVAAYDEQMAWVQSSGAQPVMMASRQLAASATGEDDYREVYRRVLAGASGRVVVHWLGSMFDPALAGYWGSADLDRASETFLSILDENAARIDGVKVSLLDKDREAQLRRRLPAGVRMYTGDDFDYPTTILGDGTTHSHAFLGAFDAIAPAASSALQRLQRGDEDGFLAVLEPTLRLARHIFSEPTSRYKTGIVFLAYLNGHQDHFRMVAGLESARSVPHLVRILLLADSAGLLDDPGLAASRMEAVLRVAGVRG